MTEKGLLVVVSGFSGAGKGSIMKRILQKYDNYALSISATTRDPRPGEMDGQDYFYKTQKQFEKMIMLRTIDDNWKENLRQLDELRHSVQNASYEQKDPLLIFKLESVKLWDNMINEMHDTISMTLTRARIHQQQPDIPMEMQQAPAEEPKQEQPKLTTQHDELQGDGSPIQDEDRPQYNDPSAGQQPRTPIVKDKMPRPNDPCPCGSGLKFKNCHGKNI